MKKRVLRKLASKNYLRFTNLESRNGEIKRKYTIIGLNGIEYEIKSSISSHKEKKWVKRTLVRNKILLRHFKYETITNNNGKLEAILIGPIDSSGRYARTSKYVIDDAKRYGLSLGKLYLKYKN